MIIDTGNLQNRPEFVGFDRNYGHLSRDLFPTRPYLRLRRGSLGDKLRGELRLPPRKTRPRNEIFRRKLPRILRRRKKRRQGRFGYSRGFGNQETHKRNTLGGKMRDAFSSRRRKKNALLSYKGKEREQNRFSLRKKPTRHARNP